MLKWRNRYELIKKQHLSQLQSVFRHRVMIVFPIKNGGSFLSVNCSDEVYYDLNTHQFTQNRLIPMELTCLFNSKLSMNLFIMLRHFFSSSSNQWYRSIVLGSELTF